MNKFPELRVEVYGHTDAFGSTTYNQRLSENRATQAHKYLTNMGLDDTRIDLTGFSELQPQDSNKDEVGRQNNRRVEFRILDGEEVIYTSQP